MTCKDCIHFVVCGGFTPSDLDRDVFDYCREGRSEEIPNIEERCSDAKPKSRFVEVPDDQNIIFVKDNWLMLNFESEHLGEAIKRSVEYLIKDAKERERG